MKYIKKILPIGLIIIIAIGGTYLFLKNKKTEHKPFTYGTFADFFTGQDIITYPLIPNNSIRNVGDQKSIAVNFGPEKFEGFDIFMSVEKITRKDSNDSEKNLIERGWVQESSRITRGGYEGRILANDLKAHPVPGSQSCNFGYIETVPLMESKNDLVLSIDVSQRDWGKDGDYSNCKIFDDKNYKYLKDMMDHVIDNIQPAF